MNATEPVRAHAPPHEIAGYRFEEQLAPRVWRALQLSLGRPVRIEFFEPGRALPAPPPAHPGLVTVVDRGADFLVTEDHDGVSLADHPDRSDEMLRGVLAALEHVHRHGLAHGDLRPETVFRLRDGSVRIAPPSGSGDARRDLRAAAALFGRRYAFAADRAPRGAAARFEQRFDVLFTLLGVAGRMFAALGVALVLTGGGFEFGALSIAPDYAGLFVALYGFGLWAAAAGAAAHRPGAGAWLLALTTLATPTLVAIPIALWTWAWLLSPRARLYRAARTSGLAPDAAAAVAQGGTLPGAVAARRREVAAHDDERLALGAATIAVCAGTAWGLLVLDATVPLFAGRALFFFAMALIAGAAAILLACLGRAVERGRALRWHAALWSLLAPVAPRAALRAWHLVRSG